MPLLSMSHVCKLTQMRVMQHLTASSRAEVQRTACYGSSQPLNETKPLTFCSATKSAFNNALPYGSAEVHISVGVPVRQRCEEILAPYLLRILHVRHTTPRISPRAPCRCPYPLRSSNPNTTCHVSPERSACPIPFHEVPST